MTVPVSGTNIVYYPVPKVACTSLKTALFLHNNHDNADVIQQYHEANRNRFVHSFYPTKRFRPWRYLPGVYRERPICVVRDPVDRFLSAFRNRIQNKELNYSNKSLSDFQKKSLPPQPDIEIFLDNFSLYINSHHEIKHHFAPLSQFLGVFPSWFAAIFNLRDMGNLLKMLNDEGVTLHLKSENLGKGGLKKADLSAEQVKRIEKIYKIDYYIWGRFF